MRSGERRGAIQGCILNKRVLYKLKLWSAIVLASPRYGQPKWKAKNKNLVIAFASFAELWGAREPARPGPPSRMVGNKGLATAT